MHRTSHGSLLQSSLCKAMDVQRSKAGGGKDGGGEERAGGVIISPSDF